MRYKKYRSILALLAVLVLIFGSIACVSNHNEQTKDDSSSAIRMDVSPLFATLPSTAEDPADNPSTPEKIDLGHKLYFEPKLSRSGIISCNTCHVVGAAGVDHRAQAMGEGARVGDRNSPTVYNAAFLNSQFWDGRAPSLEEQAKGPIQAHVEMDLKPEEAIARLEKTGYLPYFEKAFPEADTALTFDNLAKAIAAFERTLITPGSAFDQYLEGNDQALSEQQIQGLALFQNSGCISCHNGVLLGGNIFQEFSHIGGKDQGRKNVTGNKGDQYLFRVAPLRNVAVTFPYFHDGSAETLEEAVAIMGKAQLGRTFNEQEIDQLVAFLESLTGEFPSVPHPSLPRTFN